MGALADGLVGQQWYTPAELAAKLGIKARTLAEWRGKGVGPPFLRVAYRTVQYALGDVEEWLQSLRREPGHERTDQRRPVALPIQFPGQGVQRANRFKRRRLKSE